MKKVTMIVAAVALAAVVASPALAYRGGGGQHNRGPGYGYGMMDETRGLDLTTEQTQKINDLREAHLKDIKPIQDQLYAKSGDLRNLWIAKAPDHEKILALQKEVRSLRDQSTDKMTVYRLEARKVLTPEQLTKVQSYGMGQGMARGSAVTARMGGGAGMRGGHTPGWGMR
jgi:Spy/CpxP family protein refolding chaperone